MKVSARNVLNGTVVLITPGAVNTEVTIRVGPGIDIVSMISSNSVQHLGLKVGGSAYAIIKSSNVIVGAD